jgi:glycosyltransferase involved in cell wall biosynthesis
MQSMAGSLQPRLLMTADTVGGVWHYAVELSCALARRGVRVELATMGASLSRQHRSRLSGVPGVNLHESSYKLEWMQQAWDDVGRAGEWLLGLERRLAPDLVHLNQFAFGALPFTAPTLLVAHSCVLSWWRAVHREDAPRSWDEYRRRIGRGLAGAGLVAAPTRTMLESLAQDYGLAQGGLVLGNGRSPQDFRPAVKQPFICAAGRFWDTAKNLAALQAVAPLLPWPVRLAGSTVHPEGGGVPPSEVQFLGELSAPALAGQLAQASIYALPARYEPFGLSVLEAALSGCALVLGDIPSLRETWGPAALYVPPEDHRRLRETLCGLIDDSGQLARMAHAARTRALRFTTERMVAGYLTAYRTLQPAFAGTDSREIECA